MDLRKILFKYRSYTPIPFIILMIFFSEPSFQSLLIGLTIVLFGEFVRLWGVSVAGSETRTTDGVGSSQLVTSGPFAYVRNPLYVGNVCIYFGVGIMSWAGVPFLPVITLLYFFFQYSLIINLEEEHLAEKYGTEYQTYKLSVPKIFPSFKKFSAQNGNQPTANWQKSMKSEARTLQAISIILVIIIILWIK
jgi:protein-S-isoprenylcysteine O-methyltransferase Ste14